MPVKADELNRYFKKVLTLQLSTGEDGTSSEITGKVLAVSSAGIAIKSHGSTQIIDHEQILGYEEVVRFRRKRVVRRWVRIIPSDASVKQHLADRHAVMVSVLNAVDEDTARMMHDNLKHDDLGHRHRNPEERMKDLDRQDLRDEDDADAARDFVAEEEEDLDE